MFTTEAQPAGDGLKTRPAVALRRNSLMRLPASALDHDPRCQRSIHRPKPRSTVTRTEECPSEWRWGSDGSAGCRRSPARGTANQKGFDVRWTGM